MRSSSTSPTSRSSARRSFRPEAFAPLTEPLIGQKAKLSDIIDIADKIEQMYRQHGYVLTRAFVPPQTVSNGVFQINVVEGFVKSAAVSGGNDFQRQEVDNYLQPVTQERPATLGTMERSLLLANDLPGAQASGLLRPSPTEPGASDLLVNLIGQPWEATIYSDNRGAAVTGAWTLGGAIRRERPYLRSRTAHARLSGTPDLTPAAARPEHLCQAGRQKRHDLHRLRRAGAWRARRARRQPRQRQLCHSARSSAIRGSCRARRASRSKAASIRSRKWYDPMRRRCRGGHQRRPLARPQFRGHPAAARLAARFDHRRNPGA